VASNSGSYPASTVGSGALGQCMQNVPIGKSGYLYVYCSNESSNIDVYFDNLQVVNTRGRLLEETHYYPFGLTMAGISDKAAKSNYAENKYRFNDGNELQNKEFSDGTGLEMYEANFRSYDPQLGRFLQMDPLADVSKSLSPYVFASNNPELRNDPSGLKDTTVKGQKMQRDKDLPAATVTASPHKHLPTSDATGDVSPPYAEITSIALARNEEIGEKLLKLQKLTKGLSLSGAILRNRITGTLLKYMEKMFTVIDIYNVAMMGVNGNTSPLELPVIGGLSQLIIGDEVANSDEVSLEVAAQSGYVALARMLNSSVGRRSGLVGVYVSGQTLQAILANGGINSRIQNIVDPGGHYPDNPQNSIQNINYFVVFPKDSKGTITNFGVTPIH